jgi:hypothetical protein
MREIRPSGSEGGGTSLRSPYPYHPHARATCCDIRLTGAPRGLSMEVWGSLEIPHCRVQGE